MFNEKEDWMDESDDLKALDSPEDEDLKVWEEEGGTPEEPVAVVQQEPQEEEVKLELRKFVGNNYTDEELGKLRRGEVVTVSRGRADVLLAVQSSDGRNRFREV